MIPYKKKILVTLTLFASIAAAQNDQAKAEKPVLASMSWSKDKGFSLLPGLLYDDSIVARANFTNAINQTGWSFLEVATDGRFPDKVQVSSEYCTLSF